MHDDAALLRQYSAQRAQDAFAEIVRRHVDGVYSAALRRVGGDAHLAQDVTQQVFVALARKAAVMAEHPMLTGWLYTATRHEAANVVRRERRRKAREQEAQAMSDVLPDPESEADWTRVAPVLDAAIDQLSEDDRAAILARFIERRSFPDMGAKLRLSEDAARMRVTRALERLRALLARRGITSTSGALSVALANHLVAAAPAGVATAATAAATAVLPAAGLSLLTIVEFMSTTKGVAGLAVLAVIAALGTATRELMLTRSSEAELSAARVEQDSLMARLRDAEQRAAAMEEEAAEAQKALEAARAAKVAAEQRAARPAPVPRSAGATPQAIAAGQAFIERHPEVKQAVIEFCRTQMHQTLGTFLKSRNLTPAQQDQLLAVLMMESGVLRMIPGPDGQTIVIAGLGFGDQDKRRQLQETLMPSLGMDGVKSLRESYSQMPARRLSTQLADALSLGATPLSRTQYDQLVAVVSETTPGPGSRGWSGTFDWNALLPKAQAILSEPQLAMLSGLQAREQFQVARGRAMRASTTPQK